MISNKDYENNFVGRMAQRFNLAIDKDWSERTATLHVYKKIYNRTLYDNLTPWNMEYEGGELGGKYIVLARRRPSVIYTIPKIIVNESTSMLFGESHFPILRGKDDAESELLSHLADQCCLPAKMLQAARKGALGSVCVIVKVLKKKFYLDVLETIYLTPVFDDQEPGKLIMLSEKKKVTGDVLMARGYTIDKEKKNAHYFLIREWTENEENYYLPYECDKEKEEGFSATKDSKRSVAHNFGFVPAIWIKNSKEDERVDGECTFEAVIDICIEIDYQLSQLGRLLKYNSDPTVVIKDPSRLSDREIMKGIGPIELGENGDAWMLEMTSGSTNAVIDYVRCLREFAIETVRGNRANPDKMSAIHSGKALQMLNASLIGFVEDLRVSYGEGIKKIFQIISQIIESDKVDIDLGEQSLTKINAENINLDWKDWYPPTPQDDLQEAQTMQTYVAGGLMSKESAINNIADKYNIIDIKKELTNIKNDGISSIDDKNHENNSKKDKKITKNAVARQKNGRGSSQSEDKYVD